MPMPAPQAAPSDGRPSLVKWAIAAPRSAPAPPLPTSRPTTIATDLADPVTASAKPLPWKIIPTTAKNPTTAQKHASR